MTLENWESHSNDISTYLSTKLKVGKGKQVQEIKAQILAKASGIFLWVVLVVQILNKEYDKGRIHALHEQLQKISIKLNKLFKDILMRDGQNMQEFLLCIQWIFYAKWPLKREEFYFAVLSGQSPQFLTAWDVDEVTLQDMERYILDSSKGLAEMTRSTSTSNPTVQFIHESVREFLLKESALFDLWPGFEHLSKGLCHEQLKNCCYNYIRINIFEHLELTTPLPVAFTQKPANLRELARKNFPFLEYAVLQVLHHADTAEESGVTQNNFIENLAFDSWITLRDILQKAQIHRCTPKASLLYIFAEHDLPNLIRLQLRKGASSTAIEGELYGSPLLAALAYQNEHSVKALIEWNSNLWSDRDDIFHPGLEFDQDWSVFLKSSLYKKPRKGQNSLCYAAEHGLLFVVEALLEKGAEVDLKDKDGQTPLLWAASNRHEATVKALLDKGAEIDAKEKYRQTPLSRAVSNGHEAIVKALLAKGAEVHAKDEYGWTPLLRAASNGHEAIVKALLEKGAEIEKYF